MFRELKHVKLINPFNTVIGRIFDREYFFVNHFSIQFFIL